MNPIFADFNAMTESGQVRLNCRGSQDDLRAADLHPGDWAWLSDGELMVCGKIDSSPDTGIVAVPDWKTLVHLDDPHDVAAVGQELTDLLKRENPSVDELWRLFGLLTIFERIAPPAVASQFRRGFFSFRRAGTLLLLGELELAALEIEEARRLEQGHPDDDRLFLEILRRADLPRATREAESLASELNLTAVVLAECIHVLATHADHLADDPFLPVARTILGLIERFERAPGRDRVRATDLALVQFNRGLILLRLGQIAEAQCSLAMAHATNPTLPEIDEAKDWTSYNQRAREIAAQIYARPRPIAA